jgi:hypothetical protein
MLPSTVLLGVLHIRAEQVQPHAALAPKTKARHSLVNPMASARPRTVSAMHEDYRSYAEVEPADLADATTAEGVARNVFATWVRQGPIAPEDPNALVHDVKLELQYWGRLESEIAASTTPTDFSFHSARFMFHREARCATQERSGYESLSAGVLRTSTRSSIR